MTPDKIKALRIKLRHVLWRRFPQADAITIGQGVNDLVRLMTREAFDLVEMPHSGDCACWNCVHGLHADVVEQIARHYAAQQAADEYD